MANAFCAAYEPGSPTEAREPGESLMETRQSTVKTPFQLSKVCVRCTSYAPLPMRQAHVLRLPEMSPPAQTVLQKGIIRYFFCSIRTYDCQTR
jgi:hypothetical protein